MTATDIRKTPGSAAAYIILIGGLLMAACQAVIFGYAPEEATEGMIQKIFYTHMPLAWWALISFCLVFAGSVGFLLKRCEALDILCEAAAEIGVVFAGLALITGAIWARVSWNTWWTWDPRLSTTLIMWFIYAGYLIVRKMDMEAGRRRIIAAVIGIAAFLDVPLVFFATRLWPQTIHPQVIGGSEHSGMPPEMLHTMLVSLLCMGVFWLGLLLYRYYSGKLVAALEMLNKEQALSGE